jgi:predicted nucleic acid-binding protein
MSGSFLDSNVIVYMFDNDARKSAIAEEVVRQALSGDGCISFQVVQEVLNTLTGKTRPVASEQDANQVLTDFLLPMWRVMPSQRLYERALSLKSRYGYDFYDTLIIAAALEASCTRLLSEDLHDGQRIEGLTIRNPFAV